MLKSLRSNFFTSDALEHLVVKAIEDSVGDRIKEDVQSNHLVTENSTPSRIWDHLHTQIVGALDNKYACSLTNRGPWKMLVLYDPDSQSIITIMREKRFAELQKNRFKNSHMHYLEALAIALNGNLDAVNEQVSLFDEEFQDEKFEDAQRILKKMTREFNSSHIIKNHMLILFNASNYQLLSVREVMINADFQIAYEKNLSNYIKAYESTVPDSIDNTEPIYNNPACGLQLTVKATNRKKSNLKIKEHTEDNKIENDR